MRSTTTLKLLFVTLFVALISGIAYGQNGVIKGTITDDLGIYVPGATVIVEDLNKGAVSDQDGKFIFLAVPEGNHTLVVKYLGFKEVRADVNVSAGETSSLNIVMATEQVELEGVEVQGYALAGQARALNIQKNKTNITNIVSTDQIGKFPDANIGDAVKRIPGITMQVDQGEARNIIVRGLAPQLNSVTLNGSRIPSAEGDNRNIQMDLIPSDMIQTIEVNKAVTPDMDGDALGGSVNLITRSSPQDFRVSATLGSGINFITDKRIWNGSFLVGDRALNNKFGWMIAASINDNDFGSDNVEAVWNNEAESPLTEEDIDVNPYIEESDIRTYLVQRVRRSFSANFDYSFNQNHTIYLKTMYNWRDDRENRFRLRYADVVPVFADGTENVIGYQGQLRRETKGGISGGRSKNRRLEDQRMQNYTLSGDHLFGSAKMDWMASYAKASEERPNERYIEYRTENEEIPLSLDLTKSRYPSFRVVNAADVTLDQFNDRDIISEQYGLTEEEDFNFFANLTLPLILLNSKDGSLKFGGRLRFKNKTRNNNFFEYSPADGNTQNFDTLADVPTQNVTDPDFLAGSQYAAGSFASSSFLGGLNLKNGTLFEEEDDPEEYLIENYDVSEDVIAGYLMTTQQISDKLSILAGIRLENTQITAKGFQFDVDEDIVTNLEETSSYTNVLPGIHFKYDVTPRTVLRFAWTNTLARPNYIDLVPYEEIVREDEEIIRGNPALDPARSMNFDLMAEHYFKSIGILSGGVFYKYINDFVYTQIGEQAGGEFDGYETYQPLNGDHARVAGVEIAYQRQLDFLPGFAKNFGVYLNYTYLDSKANGITNEDGDERGDLELPGASPNMFNGSLSYSGKKFTARLSANYSDSYIDELGGNDFEDRYYDEQFFLDFNASFAINKNLRIYADLNNITNQPLRYFQGVRNRTQQMEFYERRLTFGLKYDLF